MGVLSTGCGGGCVGGGGGGPPPEAPPPPQPALASRPNATQESRTATRAFLLSRRIIPDPLLLLAACRFVVFGLGLFLHLPIQRSHLVLRLLNLLKQLHLFLRLLRHLQTLIHLS